VVKSEAGLYLITNENYSYWSLKNVCDATKNIAAAAGFTWAAGLFCFERTKKSPVKKLGFLQQNTAASAALAVSNI
jgi:hypothetical protein